MHIGTIQDGAPIPATNSLLARLNAVSISPAQLAMPVARQPCATQPETATAGLADFSLAEAALQARRNALAEWRGAFDLSGKWDEEAVIAAAAHFPLSENADGIGFEAAGFQKMILFIEDLPW